MLDLDLVEAVINRPHVIDLRDDGFTIMHPPACHPNLFACPLNLVARGTFEDPGLRGQHMCKLDDDGEFTIGEPIDNAPGIDWIALVAELRLAREENQELKKTAAAMAKLATQREIELRLAREVIEEYRNNRLHLMRNGIITLPSATLAAYDKHVEEASNG